MQGRADYNSYCECSHRNSSGCSGSPYTVHNPDCFQMLGDISRAEKIYLACGYTGMRKVINGMAAIVQQNFQRDSFSNSLFLFCGRKCYRLKALY